MARAGGDAFTFEQTSARLAAYELWLRVVTEDGGRELYEGPDEEAARSLAAPNPIENSKGHVTGRYSVQQIFDAYRICAMLQGLVRRGNHLYSKGPKEKSLRPEKQLELKFKTLE